MLAGAMEQQPATGTRKRSLSRRPTVDPDSLQDAIEKYTKRTLIPEEVLDGTGLSKLAREHCEAFRELLGPGVKLSPNRAITIATACTGSAGDVFAMEALLNAYRDEATDFGVEYIFNCDIVPGK